MLENPLGCAGSPQNYRGLWNSVKFQGNVGSGIPGSRCGRSMSGNCAGLWNSWQFVSGNLWNVLLDLMDPLSTRNCGPGMEFWGNPAGISGIWGEERRGGTGQDKWHRQAGLNQEVPECPADPREAPASPPGNPTGIFLGEGFHDRELLSGMQRASSPPKPHKNPKSHSNSKSCSNPIPNPSPAPPEQQDHAGG